MGFIKNVVKGVVSAAKWVVKGVAKVAKKVMKSDLGKIALLTAAIAIPTISVMSSGAAAASGVTATKGFFSTIGQKMMSAVQTFSNAIKGGITAFQSGAGWSGAVGAFTQKLGLTGMGAQVTAGAIKWAGQGAVTGAVTGALTGQDPLKMAAQGAVLGGVGGAAAGAAGLGLGGTGVYNTPPTGTVGTLDPNPNMQGQPLPGYGGTVGTLDPNPNMQGYKLPPTDGNLWGTAKSAGKGVLGWAERNPLLAGTILQGVGGGISGWAAARAASDAREEDRERTEENYRGVGEAVRPVKFSQNSGYR